MTIGSVLTQMFRPGHVEAKRAAIAMMADPVKARLSIGQFLNSIANARNINIGLGNDAYRSENVLRKAVGNDAFNAATARQVIDACRVIKHDLGHQLAHARHEVGTAQGWNRDRYGTLGGLAAFARAIQHFPALDGK